MIRPVIDYRCIVYSSASALKTINIIQSQALQISCGAFRTSPIPAMQVEMAEMPLDVKVTIKNVILEYNKGTQRESFSEKRS